MLYDSSDDDLPDIPMDGRYAAAPGAPNRDDQMKRLQDLEQQFASLREEMQQQPQPQHQRRPASAVEPADSTASRPRAHHRVRGESRRECVDRESPPSSEEADDGPAPEPLSPLAAADSSREGGDSAPVPPADRHELQDQEIQYELRRLVPHLSPEFTCAYRDAVLLLGAVRNGGSSAARGQDSLMDRVAALEAERRNLESRLARKADECAALRSDGDQARQKLRAVQQQAQQSNALMSQKREEMRKQLLIEEGRTEKIEVRNRKLQVENDDLKSKLRSGMR